MNQKAKLTEPVDLAQAEISAETGSPRLNTKPLFKLMVEKKASDLFFTSYAPVKIKIEEKPPPPPPEPPKEPPPPDPDQQHKDEIKISHLNDEVNTLQFSLKKAGVAATPEQQRSNEEMRQKIESKREQIRQLRDTYQRMYGKDYDPQKQ